MFTLLINTALITLLGLMASISANAMASINAVATNDASQSLKTVYFSDTTNPMTIVSRMTPIQRLNYRRLLAGYTHCAYIDLDTYIGQPQSQLHYQLPLKYNVTFYEKHNKECGSAPETMPRRASYAIDKYGRIFMEDVAAATFDLQYRVGERPVVINDMTHFHHPIKKVFRDYHIRLHTVKKWAQGTFVVFYVENMAHLTNLSDKSYRETLFADLLKTNGGWDFMIRTDDGKEYYVEGRKRKVIDAQSYTKTYP